MGGQGDADGPMTDRQKAEAWDRIAKHWIDYCANGVDVFDWTYDSRPVMSDLTGHSPFEWTRKGR